VDVDFKNKLVDVVMADGSSLTQAQCEGAFAGTQYTVETFAAK
jgi:hypothetical protein